VGVVDTTRRVIDGDGHVAENLPQIRSYMPPEYVGGPENTSPFADVFPPKTHFHAAQPLTTLPGSFRRVGPDEWVEFAEEVGLEAAALYPTNGLPFGFFLNGDWAIAACRAYNDWLHDQYLERSPIFVGMAMLPAIEPAAAAEELDRAVNQLGMAGGVLPATGLPEPLGSKRYAPIYEAADRLGCALAVHGGNHSRMGLDHMNVFAPVNALGHPFSQLIAFGSIVFNGVLDRYPGLRIGFLEGGAAWLALALERFDRAYETHVPLDPRHQLLALEPGERVSDRLAALARAGRFFYGCEGDEPAVADVTEQLGVNIALFSTDFPHESNAERCAHEIKELIERDDVDDEGKDRMLWENAATFYAIGDRIAGASADRRTQEVMQ